MNITFEIHLRVFGWSVEIRSREYTGINAGVFVSEMDTLTVRLVGKHVVLSRRDQSPEQLKAEQDMVKSWEEE